MAGSLSGPPGPPALQPALAPASPPGSAPIQSHSSEVDRARSVRTSGEMNFATVISTAQVSLLYMYMNMKWRKSPFCPVYPCHIFELLLAFYVD